MRQNLTVKILQDNSFETITAPGQIVASKVSKVLANDITAPLAIESFKKMGAKSVFDPKKVILVCDHFTPNKDIASAEQVKLVREFSRSQGIEHYFEGGSAGVEHALLPELGLVRPGDIVVGADSHTCTYGGIGAFATGLGSTDIAAAMVLGETWFKVPEAVKVILKGERPPFIGGKDLVLALIGQIGVDGALYKSLEFSGKVVQELDVEARMTMANMAVEAGAKAGLFPIDEKTKSYMATSGIIDIDELFPDSEAEYEQEVEIVVDHLSPQVACPHLPENVKPVEELSEIVLDQVVLGSCTNGRISDLRQAAEIVRGHKIPAFIRFIVLPATPKVYAQALSEGLIQVFIEAGAIIGPPTCGPCLGGHMGILAGGERCLATTNRNFRGRMGSLDSEVYLSSPAVAAASALTGRICHPREIGS